jgi:hypothetical protein
MIAIAEREREISEITERMFSSSEDSIRSRIAAMRTTAKSKLRDLRGLLGRDVTVARSALSNHIDKIEMDADGKVYVAGSKCNFLGNDLGMVPGAGSGPNVCPFDLTGWLLPNELRAGCVSKVYKWRNL